MAKYVFPAIFTTEDDGVSVRFPDVANCFTYGAGLADAIEMAEDALALVLYDMEERGQAIPAASKLDEVRAQAEPGEIVSLIAADTIEYRKQYDNRAVKKTLSIPAWLNTMAERAGINFSSTLQDALKQQLNI